MSNTILRLAGVCSLSVRSAHPNPTRGAVTFELSTDRPGGLTIFDAGGRRVRALTTSGPRVSWDGLTDAGAPVAPSVYFYRVDGAGHASRVVVFD